LVLSEISSKEKEMILYDSLMNATAGRPMTKTQLELVSSEMRKHNGMSAVASVMSLTLEAANKHMYSRMSTDMNVLHQYHQQSIQFYQKSNSNQKRIHDSVQVTHNAVQGLSARLEQRHTQLEQQHYSTNKVLQEIQTSLRKTQATQSVLVSQMRESSRSATPDHGNNMSVGDFPPLVGPAMSGNYNWFTEG
jgi:hypothetical protein